jgi:hypothetical protein
MGIAVATALVAQDAPQPQPPADAPSLKDTMKFIQAKLPGRVNYVVYSHDNIAGTDGPPLKRTLVVSNVSADANRCSISFNMLFDNGKPNGLIEKDREISLKQVKQVTTGQMDQVIQQANAKSDHPEQSVQIDPPIFLVMVKSEPNGMMFNFYDENMSQRVANALQHAVDLCGGGIQEPF